MFSPSIDPAVTGLFTYFLSGNYGDISCIDRYSRRRMYTVSKDVYITPGVND